jgi:threonine/homoserine/homoserine lactone efflux protein
VHTRENMDITFFIKGLLVGFSIAAPVGPVGLLCIQRTLTEGRTSGFVSGMGAATADAIYGCIAGFSITAVSAMLIDQQMWIRLAGGIFLWVLGVRTFIQPPAEQTVSLKGRGLLKSYASTFFLTLTNPVTILSFVAILTGLGAHKNPVSAGLFVSGVFTGSALWWFMLSSSVSIIRSTINPHHLRWINRGSGLFLTGAGVAVLLSILR